MYSACAILQGDFISSIEAFVQVINSWLSGKPYELTGSVSKLFKSCPGHAIPVITIESPPSCSLVHRVHYTELDVTQIRARVMPHTALLLSYLCKAPLRGGSIAEVWSFISSVWLHLHQDTSGTLCWCCEIYFTPRSWRSRCFTPKHTGTNKTFTRDGGCGESVSVSGSINSRKKEDKQTEVSD